MATEQGSFTSLGKLILVICVIIGIVGALFVKGALGYDGVLWAAAFGGAGGGIGGVAGQILARLTGQIYQHRR